MVGIWQPMLSRIKMAKAYLRLVNVGRMIGIKKMCFRRRQKVRAFAWESCGLR